MVRDSGLELILAKKIKIRARINLSRAVVRTNLNLASGGHQQGPVVVTSKAQWWSPARPSGGQHHFERVLGIFGPPLKSLGDKKKEKIHKG